MRALEPQLQQAKKIACFTDEQQKAFERLTYRQRLYVEYRGTGHKKVDAYKFAGFTSGKPAQAAYKMEKESPLLQELIGVLQNQLRSNEISDTENEEAMHDLRVAASQARAEQALGIYDTTDGETARRILFYRDILNGKIKSVKKTVRRDGDGKIIETKIEENSDLNAKMSARRELDKILGINTMPDLGAISMGDITIHIVDASKRDESKNETLELSPDEVVITDPLEEKVN